MLMSTFFSMSDTPVPVFLIMKCLLQKHLQQVQINKATGKVVAAQERLGRGVL